MCVTNALEEFVVSVFKGNRFLYFKDVGRKKPSETSLSIYKCTVLLGQFKIHQHRSENLKPLTVNNVVIAGCNTPCNIFVLITLKLLDRPAPCNS